MIKYKVREGFVVHLPNRTYEAGEVIELNPNEIEQVAHQVEQVVIKKEKLTNEQVQG